MVIGYLLPEKGGMIGKNKIMILYQPCRKRHLLIQRP